MTNTTLGRFSALVCGGLLAGCASPPPVYNPVLPFEGSADRLDGLTILPGALPEKPTIIDAPMYNAEAMNQATQNQVNAGTASPGQAAAGGIIGGLIIMAIDGAIDANRNSTFREILAATDYDGEAVFREALEASLAERGYAPVFAEGERSRRMFFQDAEMAALTNDVAFDILVNQYGYSLTLGGWAPSIEVNIKATETSTGEVLIDDSLRYGTVMGEMWSATATIINLPYDTEYYFASVDDMQAAPEKVAEGLDTALSNMASAIASLIPERETMTDALESLEIEARPEAEETAVAQDAPMASEDSVQTAVSEDTFQSTVAPATPAAE
ncbi:MAG: hypothetical protein MRY64_16040 [Hyphomonadaceae bacterium]|nr:hypothetical protein [Hyphomonadaceae bacterium]